MKILSKFSRKFRENFRKFWKYGLAKILKSSRKINGKLQNFEKSHEFLANFDFKKLILIMVRLVSYWKSLIIQKEIKKPSGKSLRFWAKNQLRFEIFEKMFKFTYKNLNGKLIFSHFLSHLPGLLSFYTPLEHNKIFGVGFGGR